MELYKNVPKVCLKGENLGLGSELFTYLQTVPLLEDVLEFCESKPWSVWVIKIIDNLSSHPWLAACGLSQLLIFSSCKTKPPCKDMRFSLGILECDLKSLCHNVIVDVLIVVRGIF